MVIQFKNQDYLYYIIKQTKTHNIDNITRTHAYQNFYFQFPEIKWAFLASIVSRNAGWNMTDLKLNIFEQLLSVKERERLFMTYERANWLIFSDAYPQLLTYKLSRKLNKPMFHLLDHFHVSAYMEKEWNHFFESQDKERLMTSLIINEQNIIQEPVLKQSFFKKHIFNDLPYRLQDLCYLNAVILPSKSMPLYGAFVHKFTKLSNRITLGKHLGSIIFHPNYYADLVNFTTSVNHTGARWDYEKYLPHPFPKSPALKTVYPPITHQDIIRKDWYDWRGIKQKWIQPLHKDLKTNIGRSFYRKRKMLFVYVSLKAIITR